MIPPPRWLPSANSKKWHSRQRWDGLGYLRARTFKGPASASETRWLMHVMSDRRPIEPGEHRDVFDSATRSLRSYHAAPADEPLWNAFLTDLDAYIWLVHRDHLDAVFAAGCSGPQARPAEGRHAR